MDGSEFPCTRDHSQILPVRMSVRSAYTSISSRFESKTPVGRSLVIATVLGFSSHLNSLSSGSPMRLVLVKSLHLVSKWVTPEPNLSNPSAGRRGAKLDTTILPHGNFTSIGAFARILTMCNSLCLFFQIEPDCVVHQIGRLPQPDPLRIV